MLKMQQRLMACAVNDRLNLPAEQPSFFSHLANFFDFLPFYSPERGPLRYSVGWKNKSKWA